MDEQIQDDVVTMVDILNDEKDIDETTAAVFAGSDEKVCTYSVGYVKRQALYSCLTCCPDAKDDPKKAIGVCLACCLECHDKHSLVELYTKRNFRCDCGIKNNSIPCRLDKSKSSSDESSSSSQNNNASLNQYNQNFSGTYCTCNRPYPDVEDTIEDEMIQCVVCEDWYHTRHLNAKVPDSSAFSEMICESCVKDNDFLVDYSGLAVQVVNDTLNNSELSITVTDANESLNDENAAKKIKLSEDACVRPKNNPLTDPNAKTLFFKDGWRKDLCKCEKCTKIYEEKNVQYLMDEEDTVLFYEEKGKSKPKKSIYDASMEALSSLDRVNQINAITSYNTMKEKLFEFLQTFVVNNQIVTEEDVRRFFTNMKANDNPNVHHPHFCR